MPFWNKADKLFTKVEKKGFDVANTLHRWTINGILLFCCYTVYGIGRDYNEQFREARRFDPNDIPESPMNQINQNEREHR